MEDSSTIALTQAETSEAVSRDPVMISKEATTMMAWIGENASEGVTCDDN